MITISYLPPNPLNTIQRQKFLKQAKDFYCQCYKCNSPDFLSAMKCVDFPHCHGFTIPTYLSTGGGTIRSSWCCEACSMIFPPDLTIIERFRQRFDDIVKGADSRGGSTPEDCIALETLILDMNKIESKLANFNQLHLEVMLKLFNFYSELAQLADPFDSKLAQKLHKDAVRIGFPLIRKWECAEDMCNEGSECNLIHKVVIDAVPVVLAASIDAIKSNQELPYWIPRYIPFLQRCYGVLDQDVSYIAKLVRR
jgi:hypothetical protein